MIVLVRTADDEKFHTADKFQFHNLVRNFTRNLICTRL